MNDTNEGWLPPLPPEKITPTVITPNNPPWGGWAAIGIWFLSVLLIFVVPSLFLIPYLFAKGLDLHDRQLLLDFMFNDPTAVVLQLAPVILVHLLTLAAAWAVVTKANRYRFRDTLGWQLNGFRLWHAAALTAVFYVVGVLLTLAFGHVENEFDKLIAGSRVAVYFVIFLAVVTAPLVEEVVYRGLLYSAFQRTFGVTASVIVVTLLFTLVHVPQYSQNNVPDIASIVTLLLLSLTLTIVRVATGNLLPCIILHTFFNGVQSIFLLLEPYVKTLAPTSNPDPTGFVWHILK
jgi:membrane protease YdiL (CAAX protease family)